MEAERFCLFSIQSFTFKWVGQNGKKIWYLSCYQKMFLCSWIFSGDYLQQIVRTTKATNSEGRNSGWRWVAKYFTVLRHYCFAWWTGTHGTGWLSWNLIPRKICANQFSFVKLYIYFKISLSSCKTNVVSIVTRCFHTLYHCNNMIIFNYALSQNLWLGLFNFPLFSLRKYFVWDTSFMLVFQKCFFSLCTLTLDRLRAVKEQANVISRLGSSFTLGRRKLNQIQ